MRNLNVQGQNPFFQPGPTKRRAMRPEGVPEALAGDTPLSGGYDSINVNVDVKQLCFAGF